jgi:aspartyl aminopeptidase
MAFDLIEGSNPNFPQESDGTHPSVLGSGLYYFWNQNYSSQFDSIILISLLSKIQSSKLRLNPFALKSSEEDDNLFTNYLSTQIGMKSIQIGLPVLGKCSARGLIDKTDVEDLRSFLDFVFEKYFH